MRERGVRACRDVELDVVPVASVVSDFMAVHADREQTIERLQVIERSAELLHHLLVRPDSARSFSKSER